MSSERLKVILEAIKLIPESETITVKKLHLIVYPIGHPDRISLQYFTELLQQLEGQGKVEVISGHKLPNRGRTVKVVRLAKETEA